MKSIPFFIVLFAIGCGNIFSQEIKRPNSDDLLQFSGVVVAADSLSPVPFASIIVKNTSRGTVSDYFGYFSFVAKKNDTLEFSAIGYTSASFIVPDSLSSNVYSLIQVLRSDTITLEVIEIYPWPSKENFKQAFLNLNLPNTNLEYAMNNLNRVTLQKQMVGMAANAQSQSRLYHSSQYPSANLLNPVAWSNFIKAWKKGELSPSK